MNLKIREHPHNVKLPDLSIETGPSSAEYRAVYHGDGTEIAFRQKIDVSYFI